MSDLKQKVMTTDNSFYLLKERIEKQEEQSPLFAD
jgi:hypothetical protein